MVLSQNAHVWCVRVISVMVVHVFNWKASLMLMEKQKTMINNNE